jgi:hypothetical protein
MTAELFMETMFLARVCKRTYLSMHVYRLCMCEGFALAGARQCCFMYDGYYDELCTSARMFSGVALLRLKSSKESN